MDKIVHLIFTMQVGGAENLLVDIANDQCRYASVTIIIVNNQYDEALIKRISNKVRVIYIGRKEGRLSLGSVLKIWKWLLVYQPDVIHCHQHNLINLLPFWRSRSVMTVHTVGVPVNNLKKYKKVFSISGAIQHDLFNRGRLRSLVVYNGVDVTGIRQRTVHSYTAEKPYQIVQVSRLHHEVKGQVLAIKVIKDLQDLGYVNVELNFIGEGPSRPYLEDLAKTLGVAHCVRFWGAKNRSWIYEHLSEFDLLVQPSLCEGFGLTIIEGIAAGLPVVASRVDGPAEILNNIPSGFLFKVSNPKEFVAGIKKVIDLTVRNQIGPLCSQSHKMIQQHYSIRKTADSYLKEYAAI